jgi:hypothetical protein
VGIPATPPVTITPPAGDLANAVLQGTLTALGRSAWWCAYGATNITLWGSVSTALTTTKGSTTASVSSGTGISIGQAVKSVNVPPGTTWLTFSGTSGTLAFAPGYTDANVITGTDSLASFGNVAVTATVQLEKSYDGGYTWVVAGVGGAGQQAIYVNPAGFSIMWVECEKGVLYSLNCTAYVSGTLGYRFSTNGVAAQTFGTG